MGIIIFRYLSTIWIVQFNKLLMQERALYLRNMITLDMKTVKVAVVYI
ncbi:Uncharacterised protein [Mycobacteroides abscessus]|nr:Uncharacterised protein [Mycobacteroides abscessus]